MYIEGKWEAQHKDAVFMTDFSQISRGSGFDPVMYLGPDSLGLLGVVPPLNKDRKVGQYSKRIIHHHTVPSCSTVYISHLCMLPKFNESLRSSFA